MVSDSKYPKKSKVTDVLAVIERKQAERALVEKEERYHALFHKLTMGIILMEGRTGHIIDCNAELERQTGRCADELRRMALWDLIRCKHPNSFKQDFTKGVQLSASYSAEAELFKPDGSTSIVRLSSCRVKIGGRDFIQTAVYDITERKKMYDALQASEEFNSSLLDSSPSPIIVHNPDGAIVYVNHAFEELTGFSEVEVLDRLAPHPWWTNETKCKSKADLLKILRRGKTKDEEIFQRKNGDKIVVEINSAPVKINGRFKHLLSSWVDITERKRAEERLVTLNEELRNLSAHLESVRENERARIAREIHDELGQSLAALKMDVCWLADNLPAEHRNLQDLTQSMVKLIDITVQRTKRLCVELRPKLLDDIGIGGTIEWLAKEFEKATGITCSVVCSLNEKALDDQRATAIFRIFQEALTNIYRHSNATVASISLTQIENKAVLQVNDNGIGIKQERIYAPQSLGLIGMRERVHYFGGDLEIKGVNNVGTNLVVRVPLPKEMS